MKRLAIFVLTALAACAQSPQLSPAVRAYVKYDQPVIALTHVRVIDGTGAPAKEDQTVVIRGGKIESLQTTLMADIRGGKLEVVAGDTKVIDLTGYTIMPG